MNAFAFKPAAEFQRTYPGREFHFHPYEEEWRKIPGEAHYQVSSVGRVRSLDRMVRYTGTNRADGSRFSRGKILRPGQKKSGHCFVALHRDQYWLVHRLVLLAFVGPNPDGQECLHGDDQPGHNRVSNLRWGTRSENMIDAYKRGRRGTHPGPFEFPGEAA